MNQDSRGADGKRPPCDHVYSTRDEATFASPAHELALLNTKFDRKKSTDEHSHKLHGISPRGR